MKKKFIALLLVTLMLFSGVLTSCSDEVTIESEPAKIYTLYTIAEEGTTQEGIRATELALNRVVFYRLGFMVKLVMVPESEYDQLIEDKLAELAEYDANRGSSSSSSSSAENSGSETSEEVLTGEVLLDRLDQGQDIEPDRPRLDLFLVRGNEQYQDLINRGLLAKLNTNLGAEGKTLNDYIYPTFINAATINKSIYGVPMNTGIGEYEYIVFDTELLEKYGVDAATMKTMEDLEDYLALIKANEPDVVPLQKASASPEFSFLFSEGFPAYVNNKFVVSSLEDEALNAYYAMIAKYNSLGYLQEDVDENQRFAVTFVKGQQSDIDALSEKMGYEYTSNVYAFPTATEDNTLQNLFCISKYCVSDDLTNVVKFLALLETDPEVQNILTYGVEGQHYELVPYTADDNETYDQVQLLEGSNYITRREYTGNSFQTYTMVGEDPLMWEKMKKQNLESVSAVDLGFGFTYVTFTADEETIQEPDYIQILESVISEHYNEYMTGIAGKLDYDEYRAENDATVRQALREQLAEEYSDMLSTQYTDEIRASYEEGTANYTALMAEAEEAALDSLATSLKRTLRTELTAQFREELGEDATDEEITARVNELLDDPEYMREQVLERTDREEIDAETLEQFNRRLDAVLNEELSNITETAEYQAELNALLSGSQFAADLEALIASDYDTMMLSMFEEEILAKVTAFSLTVLDECEAELKKAIDDFISANAEKLDMTEEEILTEIGFLEEEESTDTSDTSDTSSDTSSDASSDTSSDTSEPADEPTEPEEPEYSDTDVTDHPYFRFVLEKKITEQFYAFNGDPNQIGG